MIITTNLELIDMVVSLDEAVVLLSAIRTSWAQHRKDRTMTPVLETFLLVSSMQLDEIIRSFEERVPELPQSLYDDLIELEKLNILQ